MRAPRGKDRVPFLADEAIAAEADLLLAEWEKSKGVEVAAPVPIEDLAEIHLGLTVEMGDLGAMLGHRDVLGAIWFEDRTIRIDRSLDPALNRAMLGRFRFTLAHEVGHWRLHRQHLRPDPSQRTLDEAYPPPAVICRAGATAAEEVQANKFAAMLLMPRRILRGAFVAWRGSDEPLVIQDLVAPARTGDRRRDEAVAIDRLCRPLADRLEVSAEALRHRLAAVRLLVREREQNLFTT